MSTVKASWSQLASQGQVVAVCQNVPGDHMATSSVDDSGEPHIQVPLMFITSLRRMLPAKAQHIDLGARQRHRRLGSDQPDRGGHRPSDGTCHQDCVRT